VEFLEFGHGHFCAFGFELHWITAVGDSDPVASWQLESLELELRLRQLPAAGGRQWQWQWQPVAVAAGNSRQSVTGRPAVAMACRACA
jgi:hypothetical protein